MNEMKSGEDGVGVGGGAWWLHTMCIHMSVPRSLFHSWNLLNWDFLCLNSLSEICTKTDNWTTYLGKDEPAFGETQLPGRNKKWCVPIIPLNLWEHIPVLIHETTCQGHPRRISVLPETLPSLSSHDSCLSSFPPVLTFASFSPLQAHHWLWNDGCPSQVSSHFCWLVPIYHANLILSISSLVKGFPGLLD